MRVDVILNDLLKIRNFIIVLLTPIVLLPLILVVDGDEAKCAYCVIIMAIFWISEALPIAVTSLLPIILFPMVGLMYAKDVSSQYLNDTSALFVGGLVVAAAIEHWNIHKRMALRILMIVGSEPRWLMFGLMAPTWFMSMWISNTATTAMMIPIANAVLVQLRDATKSNVRDKDTGTIIDTAEMSDVKIELKENKIVDRDESKSTSIETSDESETEESAEYTRMCKALSLSIAYAANCGGVASLTGTGPNVVMKGQSDIIYEERHAESPVTFATWMEYGLPVSAILFLIVWMWLQIFFLRCRSSGQTVEQKMKVKEVILDEYKKLGPLTFGQGAVIGHFVVLALLWITRDLGGVGGWGDIFPPKTVTDSTSSILVSVSLFLFPAELPRVFCISKDDRKETKVPALLTWNVAEKKVPWGVVLLLGGGFALAKGSQVSGLSSWLGDQLTVFSSFDPWVMNLVLCYIVAAATEVTSNTAMCTLMMPIMAQLAMKLQVNPLYFMFPTAVATSFAFMLPVATPPNAVVFSYGHVKVMDMVSAGFVLNVIGVLVLVLGTETWGNAIFNFHSLPEVFRIVSNVTSKTNSTNTTSLTNSSQCICGTNLTAFS